MDGWMPGWQKGSKDRQLKQIYTHTVVYRRMSSGDTFSNIEEFQHNYLCHSGNGMPHWSYSLPDNVTLPLLALRTEAAHSLAVEQAALLAQGPHHIVPGCDL